MIMSDGPSRSATVAFRHHSAPIGRLAPDCDCGSRMSRDELRIPAPRAVSRVGAPVRPPLCLPVWRCPSCGCQQPRIES
jgi:hypothetical protein